MIATLSAYASIDLAKRVRHSQNLVKLFWLLLGGSALGIGIWSMHFIAMLAYNFQFPVYYDPFLVLLSVIIAVIGCILGFFIASGQSLFFLRFILSGTFMGGCIVGMHYVGMEATMPVVITYNEALFTLSIIIAIFSSKVALWIGFFSPFTRKEISWKLKLLFSVIMAIAITGMHYTGMAATNISRDSTLVGLHTKHMLDNHLLAWIVVFGTLFVFFGFFFSLSYNKLSRKHAVFQSTILDSATDGIVVSDDKGMILHANPAFYQLVDQNKQLKSNLSLQDYIPDFSNNYLYNHDYQLTVKQRIIELKTHPIIEENKKSSLWFFKDITETIESKKKIEFLAYHDPLTGLPNRYKLDQELTTLIEKELEVACIFLDLDRLKFTNDTLGHQAGDALLSYVAKRLKKVVNEKGILARVGGDEFIILLFGDQVAFAENLTSKIIEEMEIPFTINRSQIRVTVSAGVAIYPSDAANASELIRFADLAMYESKRNGKNRVTFFNRLLNEKLKRSVQIEKALVQAISRNELYLLYQPKIEVTTGKISGVEALLRWNHPELGHISPVEFIPIAEEKDLICELGDWVLKEACAQSVEWNDKNQQPMKIAVNISPLQFSKEDFLTRLKEIIGETKMDPRDLELEITESSSLAFEEQVGIKLNQIKEMGISISLDDFGTGYSSFKHLNQLPIEVLKIDKSFVDQLIGNSDQESIVRSMIQLGHNLNMKVLVEGVESKSQVDWLTRESCDLIQGYYYSKPVSPNEILEMLQQYE
jgi:diguanylate cyclase (GGDEF)-like protein